MELLILPSPARELWTRVGQALSTALSQLGTPQRCWNIGGGTILAERWRHRKSTDIDLTVPLGSRIVELHERFGGTLKTDMTALGAKHLSFGETFLRIVFSDGVIDIAELDNRPSSGERLAVIDDFEVLAKSTTQILRGKLERALREESPARDLFDIVVAHYEDARALACAVNMLAPEQLRAVTNHWRTNAYRLDQEAWATLLEVHPDYERERRQLTARAVECLEGAVYQLVRIDMEGGMVAIHSRTRDFSSSSITLSQGEVFDTMTSLGMDCFLDHVSPSGARAVHGAIRQGFSKRVSDHAIFEWTANHLQETVANHSPPWKESPGTS